MNTLFPHCYRLLLFAEYSPEGARALLLDARRGHGYALLYLRTLAQLRRRTARNAARLNEMVDELNEQFGERFGSLEGMNR